MRYPREKETDRERGMVHTYRREKEIQREKTAQKTENKTHCKQIIWQEISKNR